MRNQKTIGNYQIVQLLASGGQGNVYLAHDPLQAMPVAIKELAKGHHVETLKNEFQLLTKLRHPNVVRVHELFETEGKLYLVQKYLAGSNFIQWTSEDRSLPRICLGLAAALRGLQYIHSRSVVHRDLTPENIRVSEGQIGSLPAVTLVDFGLATSNQIKGITGTLGYIAPEVLNGDSAQPSSDLYSLGVVLLEAVTGRPPHPIFNSAVLDDFLIEPSEKIPLLIELLHDLLMPDPQLRPSIPQIMEGLSEIAGKPLQLSLEELAADYFPDPPFMGRKPELGRLEKLIKAAKLGAVRLVQLTGYGKSAFIGESSNRAQLAGLKIVSLNPIQAAAKTLKLSLGEGAQQIAAKFAHILAKTAMRVPLLVSLDGLAPDDPLTLALIRQLTLIARHQTAKGILAIWTDQIPSEMESNWERIFLPELTPEEIKDLVQGMLYHLQNIPWQKQVHSLTGGDPRQAVELIRHQIETKNIDRLALPLDIKVSNLNRLDFLPSNQRELLSLIAHSPHYVPREILAALAPESLALLEGLRSRGWISDGEGSGVFLTNPSLRQSLQDALPSAEAIGLHQRFAVAWLKQSPKAAEEIAYHLLRAGDVSGAAFQLIQAKSPREEDLAEAVAQLSPADPHWPMLVARLARLTRARGALNEALAYADRLEAHTPEAGALLRAELFLDAGQPKPALESLRHYPSLSVESCLIQSRAQVLLGDFSRAAKEAQQGLGLNDPTVTVQRKTQLENVLGLSWGYLGKLQESLAILESAENQARANEDKEILARVLNSKGITLQRMGLFKEAIRAFRECLSLFQSLGDLRLAATCALNLGSLAHRRMNLAEALAYYRQASSLGERAALGTTHAWGNANEAILLLIFGALDEAEAKLASALALAQKESAKSLIGHILLYQAEAKRLRQDLGEANRLLHEAIFQFDPSDQPGREAWDLLAAELYLLRGNWQAAFELSQKLLSQVSEGNPDSWRVYRLSGKVYLSAESPSSEQAVAALEKALVLAHGENGCDEAWEICSLLLQGYSMLGVRDKVTYYVQRTAISIRELRRRIPPSYRAAFDRRSDISVATQLTQEAMRRSPQAPPIEGMLRLLALNKELSQGLPLASLLDQILDAAISLTGAERGLILLKRGEGFRLATARNSDHEPLRRGMAKFSRTIVHEVMEQGKPLVIADASLDERFNQHFSITDLKLRAVLCVPLQLKGETIGVLYTDNRFSKDLYDEGIVVLTQAFADQISIGLETKRLLKESSTQRDQLIQAKAEVEELNRKLSAQIVRQSQELSEISARLRHQEEELVRRYNASNILGRAKPMRELFLQISRVAEADVPVFIHGESGTGKELVARAIHYTSGRAQEPFVAINCGAIPANLLESELFGYAKGAFTGAERDRPGVFEIVGGGTLLLDEIGDMSLEMQVKLLRILQEGTFRRLGDEEERKSHCRVLSASHKQLEHLISVNKFRKDLFYRLNVVQLNVPPLRHRREDIPLLVQHILSEGGNPREVQVSPAAMRALMDFEWPGNVRQLENEIKRASLLGEGVINLANLSPEIRKTGAAEDTTQVTMGLKDALREYERRLIINVLEQTRYNVSLAADQLQLHRVVLHRKIKAMKIERPEGE